MSQSSNMNIYDNHSSKDSLGIPTPPNNVRGWLMGVEGYRDSQQQQQQQNTIINKDNMNMNINSNSNNIHEYGLDKKQRRPSISSIASEDSVNLDDLIKANFTIDVDDEIDLPDLAGLDLDDSKEDFWKLDKNLPDYQTLIKQSPKDHRNTNNVSTVKDIDFIGSIKNHPELDSPQLSWSPPDDHIETLSPIIHTTHTNINATTINTNTAGIITSRQRSGSINSENSLNSYSTVTTSNQYARYGMAPMIYQSDSTSTSSRTPSRLSNYSTSSQTSSNTATGLPRPRKVSANSNGMPSPSRSITTNNNNNHNNHNNYNSISNGGNGNNGNSRNGGRDLNMEDSQQFLPRAHSRLGSHHNNSTTGSSTTRSKLAQRASHIPSPSSGLSNKSNNNTNSKPLPRLTSIPSSRSTGLTGTRAASRLGGDINNSNNNSSMTSTQRNLKSRASHIPSIYERSTSPSGSGRHSSASTIRNSVFGFRRDDSSTTSSSSSSSSLHNTSSPSIPSSSNHLSRNRTRSNDHRVTSPTNLKTSHIPSPSSIRSQSRIGVRKG